MPFYRSRRSRRILNRKKYNYFKSKNSLRKIKRDIMKNNFPTKIKFMGLPEKKTMFLHKIGDMSITAGQSGSIFLTPLTCPNIKTLKTTVAIGGRQINIWNWDKISILAIYIKIQPKKNMFAANENVDIGSVKCYYAMNNIPTSTGAAANITAFNNSLRDAKNIFTFNSNEAFSFVIKAPSTMQSSDSHIYKRYEWWSLADLNATENANVFTNRNDDDDSENIIEDEDNDEMVIFNDPLEVEAEKNKLHCGYLNFYSGTACNFNVTISYKVSLRG